MNNGKASLYGWQLVWRFSNYSAYRVADADGAVLVTSGGDGAPVRIVNSGEANSIPPAGGAANFTMSLVLSNATPPAAAPPLEWAAVFVNGQRCVQLPSSSLGLPVCGVPYGQLAVGSRDKSPGQGEVLDLACASIFCCGDLDPTDDPDDDPGSVFGSKKSPPPPSGGSTGPAVGAGGPTTPPPPDSIAQLSSALSQLTAIVIELLPTAGGKPSGGGGAVGGLTPPPGQQPSPVFGSAVGGGTGGSNSSGGTGGAYLSYAVLARLHELLTAAASGVDVTVELLATLQEVVREGGFGSAPVSGGGNLTSLMEKLSMIVAARATPPPSPLPQPPAAPANGPPPPPGSSGNGGDGDGDMHQSSDPDIPPAEMVGGGGSLGHGGGGLPGAATARQPPLVGAANPIIGKVPPFVGPVKNATPDEATRLEKSGFEEKRRPHRQTVIAVSVCAASLVVLVLPAVAVAVLVVRRRRRRQQAPPQPEQAAVQSWHQIYDMGSVSHGDLISAAEAGNASTPGQRSPGNGPGAAPSCGPVLHHLGRATLPQRAASSHGYADRRPSDELAAAVATAPANGSLPAAGRRGMLHVARSLPAQLLGRLARLASGAGSEHGGPGGSAGGGADRGGADRRVASAGDAEAEAEAAERGDAGFARPGGRPDASGPGAGPLGAPREAWQPAQLQPPPAAQVLALSSDATGGPDGQAVMSSKSAKRGDAGGGDAVARVDEVATVSGGVGTVSAAGGGSETSWVAIDFARDVVLERRIGSGAYGTVYRGRWSGRPVACKVVPLLEGDSGAVCPKAVESIRQEVQVLSRLSHPHIVQFYGACLAPPHVCIVEELAAGGSLHNRLHAKRRGSNEKLRPPMSYVEVLRLGLEVASAMAYLHPHVVHRDLKPQNVLLDAAGRAKVCDFGIAKIKDRTLLSTRNTHAGTPAYMAPEQFEGRPVSEKVDVYAFGMTLYECLTGEQPWSELQNPMQVIFLVGVQCQRPPLPASTPAPLAELINACWADSPDDRPPFTQVLHWLQAALVAATAPTSSATPIAPAQQRPVGQQ
ncbi:hypothetical protein GPECTOR_69g429 [Gonium pectorale]|uniref:Protein kinase domain-containing protein n=1 Tax=Gonium pectorale TaxID=33097 RepID=A0A150G389_GONPE|nr:hypothetical protein GPECTOR_69g429 [Gonium pectorale]|eukprot:KXZ44336.1 hypothetical protein GPECTOR_69g429 [Gonium pectorale]